MQRKDYLSNIDGWVAGRRVLVGDVLSLTESEARYEPVSPAPKAAHQDDTAPKKVQK